MDLKLGRWMLVLFATVALVSCGADEPKNVAESNVETEVTQPSESPASSTTSAAINEEPPANTALLEGFEEVPGEDFDAEADFIDETVLTPGGAPSDRTNGPAIRVAVVSQTSADAELLRSGPAIAGGTEVIERESASGELIVIYTIPGDLEPQSTISTSGWRHATATGSPVSVIATGLGVSDDQLVAAIDKFTP